MPKNKKKFKLDDLSCSRVVAPVKLHTPPYAMVYMLAVIGVSHPASGRVRLVSPTKLDLSDLGINIACEAEIQFHNISDKY